MPRTRLPGTPAFVDDRVDLSEEFDGVAVRVAMVGEHVVAGAVASWAPVEGVAVLPEVVKHADQVVGVSHLVGDMVHSPPPVAGHEVGSVVVGVAAEEDEEIADRVRPPKPEQVLVERLHTSEIGGERRHVT